MKFNEHSFQKFLKGTDYVAEITLYLIILFQTILFTSFSSVYLQTSTLLAKIETLLILAFAIYACAIRITIRKIVYIIITLLILCAIAFVSGTSSNFVRLLLLTIAVPGTIPSARKIVSIFGSAMFSTLCITVLLSLFGFLPISGTSSKILFSGYQETVYFFGFTHPNIFGTFLTSIFMVLCFLYIEHHKFIIMFIAAAVFCLDWVIGAGTAASGVLLIVLMVLVHRNNYMKSNRLLYIAYFLPLLLTGFSIWLAYNNYSNLGIWINEKISSRPNIWNAYLMQFPIKFINQSPQINLDGASVILGNGALDGGYIYSIVYWGLLAWFIYYLMFVSVIKLSLETKNYILYVIALLTIIMAFPETHMIMFFENIFLLFIGYYQYSSVERKECLTN